MILHYSDWELLSIFDFLTNPGKFCMEEFELLKTYCQNELAFEFAENLSVNEMQEKIAQYINYLIQNNFNQLVNLLYRIDVNESRLQNLLKENPGEDAGKMIANLIVERQLQKIQTRRDFKAKDIESDAEKW
jgi:hypothetical protein